jgi:hypothetical protein
MRFIVSMDDGQLEREKSHDYISENAEIALALTGLFTPDDNVNFTRPRRCL